MSGKGEMTVREMGRLGGKARAEKTTAHQRKRWGRMGGKARAAFTPRRSCAPSRRMLGGGCGS